MNDFLNKISLYDQLGFVAVGGMSYGFLWYDLNYFHASVPVIGNNAFLIAIVVYFFGHIAQALANQIIKENKSEYSVNQKKLLSQIKEYFNIPDAADSEAFGVAYLWATGNDKTGHMTIFNANYGLYRGWTIVLSIQAIFFATILFVEASQCTFKVSNLIAFIICMIFSILTYKRGKRFYKYLGDKVFQTFIILKQQK